MLCNALQCFAMLCNALQCFAMLCKVRVASSTDPELSFSTNHGQQKDVRVQEFIVRDFQAEKVESTKEHDRLQETALLDMIWHGGEKPAVVAILEKYLCVVDHGSMP